MNETIYIVEKVRVFFCLFFVFLKKKEEERMLKQKHDISDGLSEATGVY